MHWIVSLGYLLPKNTLSFLTGLLSRIPITSKLRRPVLGAFVKAFRINMDEATKPIRDFASIEEVFTRKIRPEVRQFMGPLVSPCDGTLVCSDGARSGDAIQAKGLTYSLGSLVFGDGEPGFGHSKLSWYTTIYLAPHNYHRVHSPVNGHLLRIRYFPGQLWPVNPPFVKYIPNLFVRNERLVFEIAAEGGGVVQVVMVGALNVGRIASPHITGLVTNSSSRLFGAIPQEHFLGDSKKIKIGEELGTFMLGSTVVMAFDDEIVERYRFLQTARQRSIQLGDSLLM